jgi:hypothetical protein
MDLIENNTANQNVNRHPWELARYDIIEKEIKKLICKDDLDNLVLIDIGCGDAFVVKKLTEKLNFKKSIAIDINFRNETLNELNKYSPKIQYFNNLEQIQIENTKNYIVILNDVIEHIKMDIDFLKYLNINLFDKLPKVKFYITVPAFNFLFSQHDLDLGHFRRYNRLQLKKYNKILNMKIRSSGYFFFSLFIARFLQKVSKNDKNNSNIGVSNWDHGKFYTNILYIVLLVDYKIGIFFRYFKINLPGLSTFIIFEK